VTNISGVIRRREFLKYSILAGSAISLGGIPSFADAADQKVLKFVPFSDLASFDPIWGSALITRNAAFLVWDTLYGVDADLVPRRQMIESETTSDDGLVWTFKLRDGLKFHDGQPVRSADVVASLKRWAARDLMGKMIVAIQEELAVVDDRTFRWKLKQPFAQMLFALGKVNPPCTFIMPERIAETDPFEQIKEYIGSGPMRFVTDEWKSGVKAVFEKFNDYVPRDEQPSLIAGGKRMEFDRIEWVVIPDSATSVAALQNGEVDWLEQPLNDLVPLLQTDTNVKLGIANSLGSVGDIRLNHVQPPFNDVRVRTALMMALNQEDYMNAVVGGDKNLWKPMLGYFTPGTPLYNETGADVLKGPRDLEAAKKLIAEAGQAGAAVTVLVAQDQPSNKAMGDVTADLLGKLGFKVDYVATDWASIQARRQKKTPPSEGGWNIFHSSHSGTDTVNPAAHIALRANGDEAWFGWPTSPEVEKGVADWFAAGDAEQAKAAANVINAAAIENVVYAPAGFYLSYQAWRSELEGVNSGALPLFWGVSRTA